MKKSDIHNPEHPVYEVADGSITFKNCRLSYKKDSAEKVLKDINLEIHSGETIGIIGGTEVQNKSGQSDQSSV